VTGNGLKDIDTALSHQDLSPTVIPVDIEAAAAAMGL
jgi:threonine synthase